MTPIDIDTLIPEVALWVRSVPEPVALRFICAAARDLCERAPLWRKTVEFAIDEPDTPIPLEVDDASTDRIERAELAGVELVPVTVPWLDKNLRSWASSGADESARYITQSMPNTVTVVPNASGALTLRLILKPSRAALTLPDFLLDQYATAIGKGAAGRCLLVPNQEYTNPQLGAAYSNEFAALLDTLAIRAVKGQQRAPLRSTARYF